MMKAAAMTAIDIIILFLTEYYTDATAVISMDSTLLLFTAGGIALLIVIAAVMVVIFRTPINRTPRPKTSKSKKRQQPELSNPAGRVERLMAIENEMIALRERHRTGQITAEVYVAESRRLYEKARQFS